MNNLLRSSLLFTVATLALSACDGNLRLYRGTFTHTRNSDVSERTNLVATALPTNDPSEWLFGEFFGLVAKLQGTTLTFTPDQSWTESTNGTTYTYALTSGEGTMSPEALNVTLSLTASSSGASAVDSYTFSGERE